MHKGAGFHQLHAEGRAHQLRRRIAVEAARLISEHGMRDYRMAKRKAAQHVGVNDESYLPRNREIEDALREHQRLFRTEAQPLALRARRETARAAMTFLLRFDPRLVGAVLDGTADAHSAVCLHVFEDAADVVAGFLDEHGIAFEAGARVLRLDRERSAEYPTLRFDADGVSVELTVFPRDAMRQAPFDRISERPMPRATLATLESLLVDAG